MTKSEKNRMVIAGLALLGMIVWVVILYGSIADLEKDVQAKALAMEANTLLLDKLGEQWDGVGAEMAQLKSEVGVRDVRIGEIGRDLASCQRTTEQYEREVLGLYEDKGNLQATLEEERASRDAEMRIMVGGLGTVVVKAKIYLLDHIPAGERIPVGNMDALTYSVERLLKLYQARVEALEEEVEELNEEIAELEGD